MSTGWALQGRDASFCEHTASFCRHIAGFYELLRAYFKRCLHARHVTWSSLVLPLHPCGEGLPSPSYPRKSPHSPAHLRRQACHGYTCRHCRHIAGFYELLWVCSTIACICSQASGFCLCMPANARAILAQFSHYSRTMLAKACGQACNSVL